ncbi:MAG: hypothetical protein ACI9SQ_002009 [Rubritalea sp.]|jgi:hypothetical protein
MKWLGPTNGLVFTKIAQITKKSLRKAQGYGFLRPR